MLIEDGNGKTIYMSLEDYLNLDEEGWRYLRSIDAGGYIENPFNKGNMFSNTSHSVDKKKIKKEYKEKIEELTDEDLEEILEELEEDFDTDIDFEDSDE